MLGLVSNQMKTAGMTQTNEFKDQGSYVNQIFSKSGDYQAGCFRSPQIASADGLYGSLHTDQPGNVMFYSNAKVDEALDGIRATTDPAEQTDLLKTVQVRGGQGPADAASSSTTSSATSTPTR